MFIYVFWLLCHPFFIMNAKNASFKNATKIFHTRVRGFLKASGPTWFLDLPTRQIWELPPLIFSRTSSVVTLALTMFSNTTLYSNKKKVKVKFSTLSCPITLKGVKHEAEVRWLLSWIKLVLLIIDVKCLIPRSRRKTENGVS